MLTAVVAGAAQAEEAAAEEAAGEGAVVAGARAPPRNQRRWDLYQMDERHCHQYCSNQRLGYQREYLACSQRPTRSPGHTIPITIAGPQHCPCHGRGLRNLHRPLIGQLEHCPSFQTDPRATRRVAWPRTSPSWRSCCAPSACCRRRGSWYLRNAVARERESSGTRQWRDQS
jgi:hypothetical protein